MSARILVVDDNPTNLRLVRGVLEPEGHEVRVAEDAPAALAMLEHWSPELVLMDIAMPGMDGLELTRRLKAQARFARTPIVALTSFAMPGDEARARQAGCDGYITKPIDTREFPCQVAAYLGGGG